MTVDEVLRNLNASVSPATVKRDLLILIYAESVRAAALATESCFEFLADEILATSPGKGGA